MKEKPDTKKPCKPGAHDFSSYNGEFYVCSCCGEQISESDYIEGTEELWTSTN